MKHSKYYMTLSGGGIFSHQRSIFLVSERQLVGSKDEGRKCVSDPLVSTGTKVFPRCI